MLESAWDAGVTRILIPGTDLPTNQKAVELSESHPNLYAAVGFHPGDAGKWEKSSLSALRDLAVHPRVSAIGEIGLDYYRDRAPHEVQQAVLLVQLELAAELGKPVILHSREAMQDLWRMLTAWHSGLVESGNPLATRPGVLHAFEGDGTSAQAALAAGFFIGLGGPVTFTNAKERREVAAGIALESILLETDAPFLTPHPFRGRRNEPAYIPLIAEAIADLHGTSMEMVAQQTTQNANRLFAWEPKA